MSNQLRKRKTNKKKPQNGTALIMSVFVLSIFSVLPLIVTDYYFNILETKYLTYCSLAIGAIVLMMVYGLYTGKLIDALKKFKIRQAIKKLNLTDWSIIVFWFCNVLSWVFCFDWHHEAFWGTSGRYNGVFLITIYLVLYFLVTRFFHFHQWYLDVFLTIGILVSAFGITDYFQMDIMNFEAHMFDDQKRWYTSTLGQLNTYTIYVGALAVVSAILFALEKNRKRMFWYYGNFILSSFALLMGESDNAYLTMAALFGLSPLILFKTKTGLRRYLIALSTFITILWCVGIISIKYSETVIRLQGLSAIITKLEFFPYLVFGLWLLTVAVAVVTLRRKVGTDSSEKLGKWVIYAWCIVIAAVIICVAFILYDANIAGNIERYEKIKSYVVFNDEWGTRRGYVWKRAIEIYTTKFTPLQKLFGYGADTLKLLMAFYYEGRPDQYGNMVYFDSAHNEYLHYLITIGPIGMMAYISFLGSAIISMGKSIREYPFVAAAMFVVLGYMIQAVVNISIPIATPIIFTILAMGLSKREKQVL